MVEKILLITIELTVLGDALNGEPPRITYYLTAKPEGRVAVKFVKDFLPKVIKSESPAEHEIARKKVLDELEKWPQVSFEQMTVRIED